ncbi:2-hydroxyisoflavanone dehydratase-like [Mangifera indica]|uniref:2-hydroxyisoflavanone dehydratase-like n=1 Tax=Mangifera indica TaxID=29780 RepID=UPI001CFAC650|nr:2-hydroxyisoflavanone dehydratase-like [Mangifera indica]
MGSVVKEVASELLPFLRVYKDGSVERLSGSPIVPSSPEDSVTEVSFKDITISENPRISARVYLPKLTQPDKKLPVLVYNHGGGFCFESAFSLVETKLMNSLVSEAKIVAVSVEYRLAPEVSIPVVYEDCWTALKWVASHSADNNGNNKEPWLQTYGDFDRVFIGGDSAGANIVHNILIRAGQESLPGGVKIFGAFLTHPYFWGSKPIGSEIGGPEREKLAPHAVWNYLYPMAPGGVDNPMINIVAPEAPSLAQLGCRRLLVSVAELDVLRDRGVLYHNAVKESGWKGEVELVEVVGEDHAFHILKYETENATKLIRLLASFLLKL